jgi:DNA sulfur modification protein DndB
VCSSDLPAELRAQRVLNKSRIPEIASYIVENPKEYVFSALTASIDAIVSFTSLDEADETLSIGKLEIPMDATIVINDGQHRRAAIEEALKKKPELADESIAIVFFIDAGLTRSQQMFADLNKHAVRPSQSLGVLYEHREPLAELTRELSLKVEVFRALTEKEKTSISNRSPKLFTLSGIYQATQALLRKKADEIISDDEKNLAITFWNVTTKTIPEWEMAVKREISCAALRDEFIHSHGVTLQAIGIAGSDLLAQFPDDWQEKILQLRNIDWSRHNISVWEGRAMIQGRISKAQRHVLLTSLYIKSSLGLPLSIDEQKIEQEFMVEKGITL